MGHGQADVARGSTGCEQSSLPATTSASSIASSTAGAASASSSASSSTAVTDSIPRAATKSSSPSSAPATDRTTGTATLPSSSSAAPSAPVKRGKMPPARPSSSSAGLAPTGKTGTAAAPTPSSSSTATDSSTDTTGTSTASFSASPTRTTGTGTAAAPSATRTTSKGTGTGTAAAPSTRSAAATRTTSTGTGTGTGATPYTPSAATGTGTAAAPSAMRTTGKGTGTGTAATPSTPSAAAMRTTSTGTGAATSTPSAAATRTTGTGNGAAASTPSAAIGAGTAAAASTPSSASGTGTTGTGTAAAPSAATMRTTGKGTGTGTAAAASTPSSATIRTTGKGTGAAPSTPSAASGTGTTGTGTAAAPSTPSAATTRTSGTGTSSAATGTGTAAAASTSSGTAAAAFTSSAAATRRTGTGTRAAPSTPSSARTDARQGRDQAPPLFPQHQTSAPRASPTPLATLRPRHAELRLVEAARAIPKEDLGFFLAALRTYGDGEDEGTDDEGGESLRPVWLARLARQPLTASTPTKPSRHSAASVLRGADSAQASTASEERDQDASDEDDQDIEQHNDREDEDDLDLEQHNDNEDEQLNLVPRTSPLASSAPATQPFHPPKVTQPTYPSAPASGKKVRRKKEAKHGAHLDDDHWPSIYGAVLNIVASSPDGPVGLGRLALQILFSPSSDGIGIISRNAKRVQRQDVTQLTEKDNAAVLLKLAVSQASRSSNAFLCARWREVLDWMIVCNTYRQGLALNTIDPDNFFHERGSTTRAKATQRNCTLGALRWIWLAHALGDIAFLPLLLLMGDQNTSLDGLRQMKADKFGALVEFIQTGDDHRDPEDVWRSNKTHAAMRGAARFAVKFILPAAMRYMACSLRNLAQDGTLPPCVYCEEVDREEEDHDEPSVVGIRATDKNMAPGNLRISLVGTSGFTISTPPNALLSTKYKSLFSHNKTAVDRVTINWLEPRSLYGWLVEGHQMDGGTMRRLLPSFSLIMGMASEDEEVDLASRLTTALHGDE
ncbi:hypothetical protein OC834_004041, partial [Tilletia horrida]